MLDPNVAGPNAFLRRHAQTAGEGGLPVLERFRPDAHAPLLAHGGHTLVTVHVFEQGERVRFRDKATGAEIHGAIARGLDETNGIYWVVPDKAAAAVSVDAWDVQRA